MDDLNASHAISVTRGCGITLSAEVNTGDVEDRIVAGHDAEPLGANSRTRHLGDWVLKRDLRWVGQA
jgi:hypothetical protein